MNTHFANIAMLSTLAIAAFVVYSKTIGAPAHTDPAIPIPYTNKEGNPLLTSASSAPAAMSFTRSSVPLIDANAPKKTETATFALG
jgi:hypothetical protein